MLAFNVVEEGKGWFMAALKKDSKQPKRFCEHSVTRRFAQ